MCRVRSVRVLCALCMVGSRILYQYTHHTHTHNAEHWSSKRQISELRATSIVSMRIMYEHSLSLHTTSMRAPAQQQHTCDASRFVLGENTWNVNLFMATSFPLVLVAVVIVVVVVDDKYDSVLSVCDSVHFVSCATDYTSSRFTFGTIVPLRSAWLMMFHVCCGAHLVSVRSLSRSQLHYLCVCFLGSSAHSLQSHYAWVTIWKFFGIYKNNVLNECVFPASAEYQAAARCIHQNTCTHKCFLWHFRCVSTIQLYLFYASIYVFLPVLFFFILFLLRAFYGILTNMFNALNKLAEMWMEHAFSIRPYTQWRICESNLIERENRWDRHHRRHIFSIGANSDAAAAIAYTCASFDLFCIFIVQWFT